MSSEGRALVALALLACALPARPAAACAACGCGDPTLTAAGAEQPFAGRLRSSLELRYRTDSIGEPRVDESEIIELRADLSGSWAPLENLVFVLTMPLVYREVSDVTLAVDRSWGPGDLELRSKLFVYRDRALAPRHLLAVTLGVKAPTAPFRREADGELLPLEAQAGTGSWDVLAGPSYALFAGSFSLYTSAQISIPLLTREELEPGLSLRGTLAPQLQVGERVAVRGAVEARADQPSEEGGAEDPNSGGLVMFAGGDVLVSPLLDLTLAAGARLPVVQALRGFHREGAILNLALSYDL
jgi:hypothetical protein